MINEHEYIKKKNSTCINNPCGHFSTFIFLLLFISNILSFLYVSLLVSCHFGAGRCVQDILKGYKCKCLNGFIGKYCDLDITVGPTFFEPEIAVGPTIFEPEEDDYEVGPTFFEPEDDYEVGPTFFEPEDDYVGHFNI